MVTSATSADLQVEVAFNSDYSTPIASRIWTDVSNYVELSAGVDISGGRSDERSTCDANTLSLVLDNSDGRFTPGYASGAYYPNVQVGRPIRVVARYPSDTVGNMVTANNASVETSIGDWAGTLGLGQYPTLPSSVAQSATRAQHGTKSVLVTWATHATGSCAAVPVNDMVVGRTYTASAYVYVPAGSPDVRLDALFLGNSGYTSTKGSWVRLSVTFTASFVGAVYIGVVSASATAGQQVWVDSVMVNEGTTAATFTTSAPADRIRFQGYVDSWNTTWPTAVSNYATTAVSASSQLATLGNNTSMQSVLSTEILADSPVLYFPLGEPEGSLVASSLEPSTVALRSRGRIPVVFGDEHGALTDEGTAVRTVGYGATLRSTESVAVTSSFTVSFLFTSLAAETDSWLYLNDTTTDDYFYLTVFGGTVGATFYDASAAASIQAVGYPLVDLNDGAPHWITAKKSGNTITVYVDGVSVASDTNAGTSWTGGPYAITAAQVTGGGTEVPAEAAHAHLAIFNSALSAAQILNHADAALNGYNTETADERLLRITGYVGIEQVDMDPATEPIANIDTTGAAVVDVMRKIEATDGGVLFDARGGALSYRPRSARYTATSAVTLSFDDQEVEAVGLRHDKTGLVNDVNADYVGGSIHLTDQTSRDAYGTQTLSMDMATELEGVAYSRASWELAMFADPLTRSTDLGVVNLAQLNTAKLSAVLGLDVGSMVTVSDWPAQAPASSIDYFIEGYSESFGLESHHLTFNVTPAALWLGTFKLADATRGKLNSTYYLAG